LGKEAGFIFQNICEEWGEKKEIFEGKSEDQGKKGVMNASSQW